MIVTVDNVEALIEKSKLKIVIQEEIIAVVNQLFEVQQFIMEMDSGTIDYNYDVYLDSRDMEDKLIRYLSTLTGGVRW